MNTLGIILAVVISLFPVTPDTTAQAQPESIVTVTSAVGVLAD